MEYEGYNSLARELLNRKSSEDSDEEAAAIQAFNLKQLDADLEARRKSVERLGQATVRTNGKPNPFFMGPGI